MPECSAPELDSIANEARANSARYIKYSLCCPDKLNQLELVQRESSCLIDNFQTFSLVATKHQTMQKGHNAKEQDWPAKPTGR